VRGSQRSRTKNPTSRLVSPQSYLNFKHISSLSRLKILQVNPFQSHAFLLSFLSTHPVLLQCISFSPPHKFSPTLVPSQIIRLPDRHALRTKNIIRSHKMEVEIRDRPIQRIVCSFLVSFLFSPRLFTLPGPHHAQAKGNRETYS